MVYEKAAEWFTSAAEQGLPESQYNLGILYYDGNGVEKSRDKAREYLVQAAEQDYQKAIDSLGLNHQSNSE